METNNMLMVGFDTETTGVNTNRDRIATACVVLRTVKIPEMVRTENQDIGQDIVRNWMINPGVPMPVKASEVNGLTDELLKTKGADPVVALEEIANLLAVSLVKGGVLVAFNAHFDLAILEANLSHYGLDTLGQRLNGQQYPVIDPLVLDRALDKRRSGKRRLINLIEVYGLDMDRDFHNAQADVVATLDLLSAIFLKYPQLCELTTEQLHDFQVEKHRSWACSFNKWLMDKDPCAQPVSTSWPL